MSYRHDETVMHCQYRRVCPDEISYHVVTDTVINKWLKPRVPQGCVIHSFRHSMRDRLRAVECSKEIIDQIGGWSSSDVGESYGVGFPLDNVSVWMTKML